MARRGWARRDIPWPEITHPKGQWRPAWTCIDWSRPCPSIFSRKRPLAEKTLRRIEIGLKKFVGEAADPFIVHFRNHCDGKSIYEPLNTITTAGTHHGIAIPWTVDRGPTLTAHAFTPHAPRPTMFSLSARLPQAASIPASNGSERSHSVEEPLRTIPTENRHGLVMPFLVPHFGERPEVPGAPAQDPRTHGFDELLPTITGQGAGSLAMPFVLPPEGFFRGNLPRSPGDALQTITSRGGGNLVIPFLLAVNHGGDDDRSHDPREPLATLTAKTGQSIVVPWLTKYYGTGGVQGIEEPVDTITTRDRFGLAMASLIATMQALHVVDIGFRMLDVNELARARVFPTVTSLWAPRLIRSGRWATRSVPWWRRPSARRSPTRLRKVDGGFGHG